MECRWNGRKRGRRTWRFRFYYSLGQFLNEERYAVAPRDDLTNGLG